MSSAIRPAVELAIKFAGDPAYKVEINITDVGWVEVEQVAESSVPGALVLIPSGFDPVNGKQRVYTDADKVNAVRATEHPRIEP